MSAPLRLLYVSAPLNDCCTQVSTSVRVCAPQCCTCLRPSRTTAVHRSLSVLYVSAPLNDCCTQVSLSAVRVCALNDCCTQVSLSAVRVCAPQRLLYTGLYSVLYVSAPLNDCCTQVSTQCCTRLLYTGLYTVLNVSAPPPLILTEVVSDSTTAVHRSLLSAVRVCAPQRLLYTGLYTVLYVSAPPPLILTEVVSDYNDCCTQVSTVLYVSAPLNDCCTQVSAVRVCAPQRLLYTGLYSVLYVSAPLNDCCTQVSTQCCTCLRPSTTAVHRSLLSAVRVCAPQRLLYTGLYTVLNVSAPPPLDTDGSSV